MGGSAIPNSYKTMIRDVCEELKVYTSKDVNDIILDKFHRRSRLPQPNQINKFMRSAKFHNVIRDTAPQTYEYLDPERNYTRYTLRVHEMEPGETIDFQADSVVHVPRAKNKNSLDTTITVCIFVKRD